MSFSFPNKSMIDLLREAMLIKGGGPNKPQISNMDSFKFLDSPNFSKLQMPIPQRETQYEPMFKKQQHPLSASGGSLDKGDILGAFPGLLSFLGGDGQSILGAFSNDPYLKKAYADRGEQTRQENLAKNTQLDQMNYDAMKELEKQLFNRTQKEDSQAFTESQNEKSRKQAFDLAKMAMDQKDKEFLQNLEFRKNDAQANRELRQILSKASGKSSSDNGLNEKTVEGKKKAQLQTDLGAIKLLLNNFKAQSDRLGDSSLLTRGLQMIKGKSDLTRDPNVGQFEAIKNPFLEQLTKTMTGKGATQGALQITKGSIPQPYESQQTRNEKFKKLQEIVNGLDSYSKTKNGENIQQKNSGGIPIGTVSKTRGGRKVRFDGKNWEFLD